MLAVNFATNFAFEKYDNGKKGDSKNERKRGGEHLIEKFVGNENSATLIVIGSVHGNEPGGAIALQKVSGKLEKLRGGVYFLAG